MNPFRQSPGLCGPASLKILMSYYGKDYTEEELTELCNATAEKGTEHADLAAAAEKLGHKPVAKAPATLDDLRDYVARNIPVIVGWWSEFGEPDEHYSVVYDIDNKNIYLMDPEVDDTGRRVLPLDEWLRVWYDFEGEPKVKIERWILAVPPV